jgi:Sulfotransferase family
LPPWWFEAEDRIWTDSRSEPGKRLPVDPQQRRRHTEEPMSGVEPEAASSPSGIAPAGYGTSAKRRFPDFLGIGAQKAATTWLHQNLRRHPAIWLPPLKELNYFNDLYIRADRIWTGRHRRDRGTQILRWHLEHVPQKSWNYRFIARIADIIDGDLSDDWYGAVFSLASPNQICGEITPSYALLPSTGIEHILKLTPNLRVLYLLRDPIERNWSQIRMIARNRLNADLRQIATYRGVAGHANYPEVLARWTAHLPNSQILVLFTDDIIQRPEMTIKSVCEFFNIEFSIQHFPELTKKVHVGDAKEIPNDIYDLLKAQLRPVYDQMMDLYPDVCRGWMAKHY